MTEYVPLYQEYPPVTLEWLRGEREALHAMHLYATRHDDILVLDEMVCRIVPLSHRVLLWDRGGDNLPQVRDSLAALNRALKWAWLAREEETHAAGMYAGKLKEAVAGLDDLAAFLHGREEIQTEPVVEDKQTAVGMTREEAETLAKDITVRLPLAEVEVKDDEGIWVVEATNPRRGTSQVFRSVEQFEELMQTAGRH